jgi:CTP synthase
MMAEQKSLKNLGGTMRLGSFPCEITPNSLAAQVYGQTRIEERHRHRYEFNNAYLERFEAAGMRASGVNPGTGLVEIVEIPGHPFFIASQFHPEYASTVLVPHPLFLGFVAATLERAGTSGEPKGWTQDQPVHSEAKA